MSSWMVGRNYLLGCLLVAGLSEHAWARYQPPPPCHNPFTPEQEISEGQKVAAQVYQKMPVLPEDDPVTRYLQQLGSNLVSHVSGYRWPYTFHVVASSDVNAFALPGGSIFVNLGTVQAADTEAQLAGVMAHEISHVVLRHSTCNLGKQQNKSVLYGLGSIASQVLLGSGAAGQLAQEGIGLGQGLDFLHMSRDDEKQADLLGTGTLYDAGYDPRGLPQFFEVIQAKYGAGGAQLLSDHPNPGNRTEYVNAEIATLPSRSNNVVTTQAFTRVHAQAIQEKALTAQEVQAGAWKQAGRYAPGPGAAPPPANKVAAGQSSNDTSHEGTRSGTPAGASGTPARMSRAALGLDGGMTQYQGAQFQVSYPSRWQQSADQSGAIVFAPAGAAGGSGIVYGALVGKANQTDNGVTDASSLTSATQALAQALSNQNGGLVQVGQLVRSTVGGREANAIELRGRSPVSEGGTRLAERDWLVAIARPDGDLAYVVFVAPEQDFALIKPVFQAMLVSFRVQ